MTRAGLVLVALALVAPVAVADHAFSHRVVVTGRVVDVEGLPAPGVRPVLRFEGVDVGGACFDSRDERAGAHGDFGICRHAHVLREGGRVNVTVGDASVEAPLDKDLRKASVLLQLPVARTMRDLEADRTFPTLFRVEGRALRYTTEPQEAEGIPVAAVPLGANVTVSLVASDGTVLATREVRHDEHGDYEAELQVSDVPEGARAAATAGGAAWSVPASPLFRRAEVDLVQAAPEPEVPTNEIGNVPMSAALAFAGVVAAALLFPRRE